ncbi:riboflavin synthase [Salisediminibacterium selenitireducens]|uniref:Riboflavin synthase n=1 Tax=Bacillus selenitireducens (strain ATCC 700615 / DSM 15326 / MLS10) TaxID=439292 RepID=D6XVF5_BACIE|nr:riboflavin synthase [Salisediminibacterium selenitireducens]ADH99693.1 riboflavin synthase, alpha subunit [[Bacillus] selenitireducens MLS10]
MFTGIIEEKGKISQMKESGDAIVMTISGSKVLEDVHMGDSIAVNGVCLTVTGYTGDTFSVDVMPETVRNTSLRNLGTGSSVNLERAMAANGRFGGHFVSGHVDGIGTIRSKKPEYNAVYYEIEVAEHLRDYMTMKGSVSVDGTSLTIFGLTDRTFTISIIPHTLDETVIGSKGPGDIVNIECDMLAKYMDELLNRRFNKDDKPSEKLTEAYLKEHGFYS